MGHFLNMLLLAWGHNTIISSLPLGNTSRLSGPHLKASRSDCLENTLQCIDLHYGSSIKSAPYKRPCQFLYLHTTLAIKGLDIFYQRGWGRSKILVVGSTKIVWDTEGVSKIFCTSKGVECTCILKYSTASVMHDSGNVLILIPIPGLLGKPDCDSDSRLTLKAWFQFQFSQKWNHSGIDPDSGIGIIYHWPPYCGVQ